jgi:hypothetical protein
VCFFTDSSTAEAAIYKGTSKSQKLFALVNHLKVLEEKHFIHLVVCHVAGTRMIAEGGDGASRGILNEGVMSGEKILSLIPLHLSALEWSPTLLPRLNFWTGEKLEALAPKDWCELGHGIRGWTQPKDDDLIARPPILRKGASADSRPRPPLMWRWSNCEWHGSKDKTPLIFLSFLGC